MHRIMRRIGRLSGLLIMGGLWFLVGCHMAEGFGRDLQSAGHQVHQHMKHNNPDRTPEVIGGPDANHFGENPYGSTNRLPASYSSVEQRQGCSGPMQRPATPRYNLLGGPSYNPTGGNPYQ